MGVPLLALAAVWVLAAVLLSRLLPDLPRRGFFIALLVLTAWAAINRTAPAFQYRKVETRAGTLRGDRGGLTAPVRG